MLYICNAINDRFFRLKCRFEKQFSCIYLCHCLSEVRGTHGNKSGPVIRLVREACPVNSSLANGRGMKVRF